MSAGAEVPARIEKVMSISLTEFTKSLAALIAPGSTSLDRGAVVPLGEGRVSISCEPLGRARLGGLLDLPRARVVLQFENVAAAARADFVRRFDIAFQRGGG